MEGNCCFSPFAVLKVLGTGPLANHVNFAFDEKGKLAYVMQCTSNQVLVFRTDDFSKVTSIPVGTLPHGVWPSSDDFRVYVGLENANAVTAIDTLTHKVIATVPIGQIPQGRVYVPGAVTEGDGKANLQSLGRAGQAASVKLAPPSAGSGTVAPTSVAIFEQGLAQILQAAVAGLEPRQPYLLALDTQRDGKGTIEPLAAFTTYAAGAAVVSAVGQIRQLVRSEEPAQRRYLAIVPGTPANPGAQCRSGRTDAGPA